MELFWAIWHVSTCSILECTRIHVAVLHPNLIPDSILFLVSHYVRCQLQQCYAQLFSSCSAFALTVAVNEQAVNSVICMQVRLRCQLKGSFCC